MKARPGLYHLLFVLLSIFAVPQAAIAANTTPPTAIATPLFAENVSWHGFVKYWKSFGNRADRIVFIVALVGGFAFFIIMRTGKWR